MAHSPRSVRPASRSGPLSIDVSEDPFPQGGRTPIRCGISADLQDRQHSRCPSRCRTGSRPRGPRRRGGRSPGGPTCGPRRGRRLPGAQPSPTGPSRPFRAAGRRRPCRRAADAASPCPTPTVSTRVKVESASPSMAPHHSTDVQRHPRTAARHREAADKEVPRRREDGSAIRIRPPSERPASDGALRIAGQNRDSFTAAVRRITSRSLPRRVLFPAPPLPVTAMTRGRSRAQSATSTSFLAAPLGKGLGVIGRGGSPANPPRSVSAIPLAPPGSAIGSTLADRACWTCARSCSSGAPCPKPAERLLRSRGSPRSRTNTRGTPCCLEFRHIPLPE